MTRPEPILRPHSEPQGHPGSLRKPAGVASSAQQVIGLRKTHGKIAENPRYRKQNKGSFTGNQIWRMPHVRDEIKAGIRRLRRPRLDRRIDALKVRRKVAKDIGVTERVVDIVRDGLIEQLGLEVVALRKGVGTALTLVSQAVDHMAKAVSEANATVKTVWRAS